MNQTQNPSLNPRRILIVVAHPDDEVLGCGGAAASLSDAGHIVHTCILSGKAEARNFKPEHQELLDNVMRAHEILGIQTPILGDFPNIRFNTVPHLSLVQFIENAIRKTEASWIFTHFPGDVNNDHLHTSAACQAAARLSQRGAPGVPPLEALFYMETPSATDWSFASNTETFRPDTFVPITETLDRKLEALSAYKGVMRPHPHPRSVEAIRGLAAYRGGQCAFSYAEAFQTAFRAIVPGRL